MFQGRKRQDVRRSQKTINRDVLSTKKGHETMTCPDVVIIDDSVEKTNNNSTDYSKKLRKKEGYPNEHHGPKKETPSSREKMIRRTYMPRDSRTDSWYAEYNFACFQGSCKNI